MSTLPEPPLSVGQHIGHTVGGYSYIVARVLPEMFIVQISTTSGWQQFEDTYPTEQGAYTAVRRYFAARGLA